jgi:hypothetical protein
MLVMLPSMVQELISRRKHIPSKCFGATSINNYHTSDASNDINEKCKIHRGGTRGL